jgi:hypothetical protein
MFTHPDLLNTVVKQHMDDLHAEAERGRLLSLARRHRRSVAATRKAAAVEAAATVKAVEATDHAPATAGGAATTAALDVTSALLDVITSTGPARRSPRGYGGRGDRKVEARERFVSAGQGNLSACDPRAV